MPEYPKTFGERVAFERRRLNWTQQRLSIESDVSTQTISAIENGTNENILSANLLSISKALGVSTDYLLRGILNENDVQYLEQMMNLLSDEQNYYLRKIILILFSI